MKIRNKLCPVGYKLVEYLQSTGTQYIELPFGFERGDKVEFDFSMDANQTTDKYMVSPKTWNNNSNRFAMGVHGGRYTCGFGNISTGSTYLSPTTNYNTEKHHWVYENSVFTITDLNLSYNGLSNTFGGVTANLKLFYGYNANTKGKIYSYKHWKDNSLMVNLIPVIRNSDEEPGLYDLIHKTFYPNNGTGDFLYGDEQVADCKVSLRGNDYEAARPELPSLFQQVEYIESTGTQYIDTLYVPQANYKYIVDFSLTSFYKSGQSFAFLFSSYAAGNRYCLQSRADQLWVQVGAGNSIQVSAALNTHYLVECTASTYTINGTTKSTGSTFVTGGNGLSFQIFADSRYNGNVNQAYMKLYACKIYEGDTLVRDFVPCYRRSDSVIGIYDLVNDVFYTNSGTGTFTKGNNISGIMKTHPNLTLLPGIYQQVDYVQSSGASYVDIDYICKTTNITMELDMAWTGTDISKFETFIGFMYSSSTVTPRIGLHKYSSNFMFGADNTITTSTAPVKNERFIYKGDFTSGNQKLYKNGSLIGSTNSTYTSFTTNTCPTYVFARYCPNSQNFAYMKLYSCKIYEGNILVKDLIPCYRKQDEVSGLYDIINKSFYPSQGTGSLTHGNNTVIII